MIDVRVQVSVEARFVRLIIRNIYSMVYQLREKSVTEPETTCVERVDEMGSEGTLTSCIVGPLNIYDCQASASPNVYTSAAA